MEQYKHGVIKVIITYIFVYFMWIIGGSLFDLYFVLKLVEVDPVLTMIGLDSPIYISVRQLGFLLPSLIVNIFYIFFYIIPILKLLIKKQNKTPRKIVAKVLKLPQIAGLIAFMTWMIIFCFITTVDLIFLNFPIKGQKTIYIITTFAAMLSSSIFTFMGIFLSLEYINKKIIIPMFFPNGMISIENYVKPMTFTTKLVLLWLAVGFYPLVVLGLGFYPRGNPSGLEKYAWSFIAIIIPVGAFLLISMGKSFQRPIKGLLKATEMIASEDFNLDIKSEQNDELGYLTDRVIEMAHSLKEKQHIKETFGRMVDPRVRDMLLSGEIKLGGERKYAAVLFCDIRGFTQYSEYRDEADVVNSLNEHLAQMERCIVEQNGMINKFLGDGLLALFGLPIETENPSMDALKAAMEMIKINKILNISRIKNGKEKWHLGIGIHYGPVLAGNIGSPTRMEYTAIGNTVNTASRIQEFSKKYPGEIYFTSALKKELIGMDSYIKFLGHSKIRGKDEKEGIWIIKNT
ncbi:MAG: adenylate/guanylate cyclase domain-containing protein [Spirochaetaceae bacterium]